MRCRASIASVFFRSATGLLAAAAIIGIPPARAGVAIANVQLAVAPARLDIFGSATLGCTPRIDRIAVDGSDISAILRTAETGCRPGPSHPFHLTSNLAQATALPQPLPLGVYRIRVYDSPSSGLNLIAFRVVDTTPIADAPLPESGFWWSVSADDGSPAGAATGVGIERQGQDLAAELYGFDDAGAPTWFFGSGTLRGRTALVPLVKLAGGTPLFHGGGSAVPNATGGPQLDIVFDSPTSAHAYLVRTDPSGRVDVRSMAIARTPFAATPPGHTWAGRWVMVGNGDVRPVPQVFDFSGVGSVDSVRFTLSDAAADATLDCRLAEGTTRADLCTLSVGALPLATFDKVGIDHMAGIAEDGSRVELVRVPHRTGRGE